jgi:hypothetical protein
MIFTDKKFIFNTVRIVMEDDKIDEYLNKKKYQKIVIITYNKLNLGKDFHVHHKLTPNIYLDCRIDEILGNFNSSTRNQINRTFKEFDLKFVSCDKNFDKIYEIYKKFEYAQKRVPFSKKTMKCYLAFCAYYKQELISLILCFDSFPYLRARSICSRRLETENKEKYRIISIATRRLVYEICKYGKEHNYQLFDLGSMPADLNDPKKVGIAEFKSSFGAKLEDEYTYTYKSMVYKFFEKFVKIKLFLFGILKK